MGKKESPDERARREAERAEVTRLLSERIAYHEAKLAEERDARERAAQRRRRRFFGLLRFG